MVKLSELEFITVLRGWSFATIPGYRVWHNSRVKLYDIDTGKAADTIYKGIGALEAQCILNLISEGKEIGVDE